MSYRDFVINLISLPFRFIPRNPHLWVTGKTTSWEYDNSPPAFFDNSKHFFLYLVNETNEKVYWISSSKKEIELLRSMNLPVVPFPSLKAIMLVLRAKFSFHHYGPNMIDSRLQRGSIQLDFWHGTPLKKIRYDVVEKPIENDSRFHSFMCKGGVEFIFSTSKYLSEKILIRAFATTPDKVLEFGYPRMDVMGLNGEENIEFCKKYSTDLIPYIKKASKYKYIFLYMPTYRDDDPNYFDKADINFDLLSEKLKAIGGILFLKLHPLTAFTNVKEYDNIVQISNDIDIYPFLSRTDFLITDYSSIFFDYLQLDKEIIFIPYDYDNYVSNRELYFDYEEITPGVKYHSFSEFIDDLENVSQLDYKKEREIVKSKFFDNYSFDACKKTYQFIKDNYQ